jgi:hypothetical protein
MTPDLEALVVAAYVFADEYPVPARPGPPAKINDAELVALAVCQSAMGISSYRQLLGLVAFRLPGWFPHLPSQSQYNRRLRALTGLLTVVQQRLGRLLDAGGANSGDGPWGQVHVRRRDDHRQHLQHLAVSKDASCWLSSQRSCAVRGLSQLAGWQRRRRGQSRRGYRFLPRRSPRRCWGRDLIHEP